MGPQHLIMCILMLPCHDTPHCSAGGDASALAPAAGAAGACVVAPACRGGCAGRAWCYVLRTTLQCMVLRCCARCGAVGARMVHGRGHTRGARANAPKKTAAGASPPPPPAIRVRPFRTGRHAAGHPLPRVRSSFNCALRACGGHWRA
jgi:hypothetical protein